MSDVLIDGVRYVPANEQIREASVNDVLQALWEGYMGKGEDWQNSRTQLYFVLDDGPDDPSNCTSLSDLAVQVSQIMERRR